MSSFSPCLEVIGLFKGVPLPTHGNEDIDLHDDDHERRPLY